MQSWLSASRTARLLPVPIMPENRLTPTWSRSFSTAGVVNVGLNWSSSMSSSKVRPGTSCFWLAYWMYALKPCATGANAAAAAPPDSGMVLPILMVPSIFCVASGGQFEVSTLYSPPPAELLDWLPPLAALPPLLLSLLHAAASMASDASSTSSLTGLLRVIQVPPWLGDVGTADSSGVDGIASSASGTASAASRLVGGRGTTTTNRRPMRRARPTMPKGATNISRINNVANTT